LAHEGNVSAEELLIQRNIRLVRICSRPFFLVGGDSEDLIQEGLFGLISAIRTFDPGREISFRAYAEKCIKNRLCSAIRSALRLKHLPLNDYVSLESPQFDESHAQNLPSYLRNPEELLISRECVEEALSDTVGALSKFESAVLRLFLSGLTYEEIAAELKRTSKSVDNAVQRIRKKLTQRV
jgi:RNA polymerase sporulation-specific sigma factor